MKHPVINPGGRPPKTVSGSIRARKSGQSRIMMLLGILLVLLISANIVHYWVSRTNRVKERLLQSLLEIESMDRSELQYAWNQRITWTPTPESVIAMAVLPRMNHKKFDAIYVVFENNRVDGIMAITSFAGFYNGSQINTHEYPEKMLARHLNIEERKGLWKMISLLEMKSNTLDPQSDAYSWTRHVLGIARRIHLKQGTHD